MTPLDTPTKFNQDSFTAFQVIVFRVTITYIYANTQTQNIIITPTFKYV